MSVQYVPPLTPEMIPAGCYAVWNMTTEQWEFPVITRIEIKVAPNP